MVPLYTFAKVPLNCCKNQVNFPCKILTAFVNKITVKNVMEPNFILLETQLQNESL